MRKLIPFLCCVSFLLMGINTLSAQAYAIIGANGDAPDGVSIVALEDAPAGTVIHVTDNNYSSGGDSFSNTEGTVTVTLTSGLTKGDVIVITDAGATWTLTGAAGSAVEVDTDFNISTSGDAVYIYSTDDNLNTGDVTNVYAVSDNRSGTLSAALSPVANYPGASVLDFTSHQDNFDFTGDRAADNLADLIDPANYNYNGSNITLDVTNFTGASLPVELKRFSANKFNKENILSWTTASELNNEKFMVERSNDGKRYYDLGSVKGAGFSSELVDYSFTDFAPTNGVNYYRLKQMDFDGQFDYSSVVKIDNREAGNIKVYPTTFAQFLTVETEEDAEISIYAVTGQLVYNRNVTNKTNVIDLSELATGTYYTSIISAGNTITKQIIKQ